MTRKMLIDASHPEETRVVVVNQNQVEELDYESSRRKQLRGNVYLARVTRVEPSLQAAFVEYGGNRHGFLAFSEIHPDYYQIPFEDRQALLAAEAEDVADAPDDSEEDESEDGENGEAEATDNSTDADEKDAAEEAEQVRKVRRKKASRRRYKIQEVIKRGQILLVQVVKEERGNKGAALTSYLSLAGRYCVLMPNTPRGGGISRKISNGTDRKRLKSIVQELEVAKGTGVIVRTAGASRNKTEIKRDYDYLIRLWENIRQETLKSIAPSLIHEEGNLVKRSIRDLYNKDIDEVLVEGAEAYKTAKSFMKTLVPSHAKKVQPYTDDAPLFQRYKVEDQLESTHEPVAQLKSGGYLVIHPTEALVSVDVNSGRSTRERNIERTALKTNLEAAEEVARQIRLRDLAGLIVIDFIDMDENKNTRAVEKKMKEVLKLDRARVQMSRISQFGLMEISRQRRRRSLLEGSSSVCQHCGGVGRMRSVESSSLKAIRAIESEGVKGKTASLRLTVDPDVALYIFNSQRELLQAVEERFDMSVELASNRDITRPAFEIETLETRSGHTPPSRPKPDQDKDDDDGNKGRKRSSRSRGRKKSDENDTDTKAAPTNNAPENKDEAPSSDDGTPKKRRRRRGKRGGRSKTAAEASPAGLEVIDPEGSADIATPAETKSDETPGESEKPKRRRRRRTKKDSDDTTKDVKASDEKSATEDPKAGDMPGDTDKPKRRTRRKPAAKKSEDGKPESIKAEPETAEDKPKPKRTRRKKATPKAEAAPAAVNAKDEAASAKPAPELKPQASEEKPKAEKSDKPKKRGWWQRKK